jgi:hypothetical protein
MKSLPLVLTTLFAAALAAQDQGMPNPKHPEHDALKQLVGTWEFNMKMEAMPGVPGMEKASEAEGSESAELICNGIWLKSVINSTWQGAPFQGIWIAGYDPFAKKYTSYWVSSDENECGLATMDGTYDAAKKTWTWNGKTPNGPMRSVYVFSDPDTSIETCYATGPDGKETKCMEITRKRSKAPIAAEASAKAPAKVGKEHAMLHEGIGEWNAAVTMAGAPGQPASTEKGTEIAHSTCNGRWIWSHFSGQMMGAPFEGHGIVGYDPNEKKYVSVWIDSMNPCASKALGTYDEATKSFTFTGNCTDCTGQPMTMHEVLTVKDPSTRLLKMEFKTADKTEKMQIEYTRKTKG